MSMVLRDGLGRPLTHDEVDGNFIFTDIRSVARSLNVSETEVIFATDTTTVLDNVLYIYDASAQTTWGVPALDSAGKTIVEVDGSDLTTAGGTGSNSYTLIDIQVTHNLDTLQDAVSSIQIKLGDKVDLKERTAGNGGGAIWDVVLASSVTPNTFNIIQCTGITDYALVLRIEGNVWASKFGVVSDGSNQDAPLQAAIDYAESLVEDVAGKDQRGGVDVIVEGTPVIDQIRISKNNVGLCGIGGTTFLTNRTYSGNPEPAIVVGTAEEWQNAGVITGTTKYNKLLNFRVSRDGGSGFIAILLSGVRNPSIENVHVETQAVGMWVENCSELNTSQFTSIGCTYGIVGDNRKNRPSGSSPLGVACVDNDVSACTFTQTTVYFPQHTGILLINSGTMSFYGGTMGDFSVNPLTGGSIFLGLSNKAAGIHYWGGLTSFTRGGTLEDWVYEPDQSSSKDCILITSEDKNNPVRGLAIREQHVQTYSNDYVGDNLTTLLVTDVSGTGVIADCSMSNSGFTYQTSGFQYPPLYRNDGTAARVGISLRDNYPADAYSTSKVDGAYIADINYLEKVDFESTEADGVTPTGWTTGNGTASTLIHQGGSAGVQESIQFTNDTILVMIGKEFTLRNQLNELGAIYVSFWYKGDLPPYVQFVVNGQGDTDSTIKDGTNLTRYGTALEDAPQSTEYRRATYVWNSFSASTPFDKFRVRVGRPAGLVGDIVEMKGLEVGYFPKFSADYNVFS